MYVIILLSRPRHSRISQLGALGNDNVGDPVSHGNKLIAVGILALSVIDLVVGTGGYRNYLLRLRWFSKGNIPPLLGDLVYSCERHMSCFCRRIATWKGLD